MADVLQPFVSQNTPIGMLQQSRPSSADNFQNIMSQHNQSQQQHQRVASMPRSFPNTQSKQPQQQQQQQHQLHPQQQHHQQQHANGNATGYRGTAAAPTYAFKATPQLRSTSASGRVQPLASDSPSAGNRQRFPGTSSVSTTASSSTSSSGAPAWGQQLFSKDDSVLTSNFEIAPFTTTAGLSPPVSPSQNTPAESQNAVGSPDRYRRGPRRSDSNTPQIKTLETPPTLKANANANSPTTIPKISQFTYAQAAARQDTSRADGASESSAATDTSTSAKDKLPKGPASMSRYRRRSQLGSGDEKIAAAAAAMSDGAPDMQRPQSSGSQPRTDGSSGPARTFAEVARRTNVPSPLSRPLSQESQAMDGTAAATAAATFQQSPAVAAMAALNDKENKGVKSKLRRAFFFSSSTDVKRVSEQDAAAVNRAAARREQFSSELDEEQDAIARQQEASGLGHNIYSGQAGFTGSTDNLSIASTASSASMMLRKMGKGMKKGGRSIKGLFRPKSVVGVPAADGPAASVGPISMVTVEAEREKVNVNADPHTQAGGGTGFPRLERNSVDVARAAQAEAGDDARRSILGGEHERAEVLAAVKRGILKRNHTGPSFQGGSIGGSEAGAPFEHATSPAPSDASSAKRGGHRRNDSIAVEGDDYFNAARFKNNSTRSLPATPGGSMRNIKFSPRIAFHEVWSASDYDRRGEIATCNRLTPMLAQQIKEELNTFKMEMEVHELSKPHTHFF